MYFGGCLESLKVSEILELRSSNGTVACARLVLVVRQGNWMLDPRHWRFLPTTCVDNGTEFSAAWEPHQPVSVELRYLYQLLGLPKYDRILRAVPPKASGQDPTGLACQN